MSVFICNIKLSANCNKSTKNINESKQKVSCCWDIFTI